MKKPSKVGIKTMPQTNNTGGGELNNSDEKEESYKRTTAIATLILAAFSVLLNFFLLYNNYRLDREQYELLKSKSEIESKLNLANLKLLEQKSEDGDLQKQVQSYVNSVDIHQSYMILSGNDLVRFTEKPPSGTFKNLVFNEYQKWIPTTEDEIGNHNLMVRANDGKLFHAMVVFHVRNRGKVTARNILLNVRKKVFDRDGERDLPIWGLNYDDWENKSLRIGDLEPGKDKFIPLLHNIGTKDYMGIAYMPVTMEWNNPITQVHQRVAASKMLPIDEWQMQGLVFVSQ